MERNAAVESLVKSIEGVLKESSRVSVEHHEEFLKSFYLVSALSDQNTLGDEYFKLEDPVYGLFTTINVNYASHEIRSMELSSFPDTTTDILRIEALTNMLYDTLKDYTIGQGRFNSFDIEKCGAGNWRGKLWVDYQSGAVIDLKLINGYLSLAITNSAAS